MLYYIISYYIVLLYIFNNIVDMICMYIYYIHLSTLANRKWTQMNSSWRAQRIHPMEATPQDQLRAAFYRPGLLTGQGQDPHSPISGGSCAHHRYTHGQLYLSRHGPSAQWDVGEEVIWRCLNYRTMTQFNTIPWLTHNQLLKSILPGTFFVASPLEPFLLRESDASCLEGLPLDVVCTFHFTAGWSESGSRTLVSPSHPPGSQGLWHHRP